MQLEHAIKKRKSIRRFSSKKPDWRKILRAIDAARYAPTAGNMFRLKFILVKDEKKIKRLKQACQQDFVGKVSYVLVVVSNDLDLIKFYHEKGEKFARQQAGAAIENFLLELTAQGLVTCWVGYFLDEQVKEILDIPEEFVVEAVFPIGKETKIKTSQKPKPELENIIYFDTFENKYMKPSTRVRLGSA